MKKVTIFQVDAFTDTLFRGNPAAICFLDEWLDVETMQSIGAENNLAETAFVVKRENHFEIRWFTPTVEVDLCGHATLAAAFVIFNHLGGYSENVVIFQSQKSGELKVSQVGDILRLDFPTDDYVPVDIFPELVEGMGTFPVKLLKGRTDYLVVLENETDVKTLAPNFEILSKIPARGIIATSSGDTVDFVSRFFAPQSGINEDPVTGSAHTTLIPYWSKKLNKKELIARQVSSRGGDLYCSYEGSRVIIGGKARLYLIGEIFTE